MLLDRKAFEETRGDLRRSHPPIVVPWILQRLIFESVSPAHPGSLYLSLIRNSSSFLPLAVLLQKHLFISEL